MIHKSRWKYKQNISFLDTSENINRFLNAAEKVEGEILMERDGIVINAKSTLGVVAMNVDIPFNIEYPSNAVFFESELNALIG